jgi:hypothetical protein
VAVVDAEAVELQQLFFADEPNVCIRHFPMATCACLRWQAGVVEKIVEHVNGHKIEEQCFRLILFASTRDALVEKLNAPL